MVEVDETDDDPDTIFIRAVAEIDTQPLPRRTGRTFADVLQTIFCVSLISVGLFGIVWQVITYPHTLVILYAREHPASITVTLAMPIRTLAPVTLTRSATTPTTGHGHQDARAASGILTFYNGSANTQYVPVGSMFTGNDGMKVTTDQSITVPAANLPAVGSMTVSARALLPGSQGNIAAFDVNVAFSSVLKVRNEVPFTNGRDARDFQAVAKSDLLGLTSNLQQTLTQVIPQAFVLQSGEALHTISCQFKATSNYQSGEEAHTVTMKAVDTCQGIAFAQSELRT